MHSSSFDTELTGGGGGKDGGEVLVAITALVTEGRIPGKLTSKSKGFYEGPHCALNKSAKDHKCDLNDVLCSNFESVRGQVLDLWRKSIPICVEILLTCSCQKETELQGDSYDDGVLLEKWYFNISHQRTAVAPVFNIVQLLNAIRSQLYFSQLTAWLTVQDDNTPLKITKNNLRHRLTIPGEIYESTKFSLSAIKHDFPPTDIGNNRIAHVSFLSLPRMTSVPKVTCQKCSTIDNAPTARTLSVVGKTEQQQQLKMNILDDRMHIMCTLKGKHRCEDFDDNNTNGAVDAIHSNKSNNHKNYKSRRVHNNKSMIPCGVHQEASTSKPKSTKGLVVDIEKAQMYYCYKNGRSGDDVMRNDRGKMLLDAIERVGLKSSNSTNSVERKKNGDNRRCDLDKCILSGRSDSRGLCDIMSESDISSIKGKCKYNDSNVNDNDHRDSPLPKLRHKKTTQQHLFDNNNTNRRYQTVQRLQFDNDDDDDDDQKDPHLFVDIPTASDQAKFRKELDSAASMVFHSRTGLPLTSSPAPVRRGKSCFDFDSSINSVSAIKSALYPTVPTDDESESDGSIVSPCSPETLAALRTDLSPVKYHRKGHAANLLGSFEESVLNGRLEPVSTVHGFTAELGASGSFVPKHLVVPVTVFFYTLGDNDKVSSPYLGHINLGRKGYNVPKSGTVQVTLFNPLGTVVKMFVIMYDLSDMPPNSQTFIRQRTLYMPTNCKDENAEWGPKWLRYLVHLRFISSKSGKIYLHSDIRMIIFRKSDMDTATGHGIDMSYELRSFTHMPANPRFSPRK